MIPEIDTNDKDVKIVNRTLIAICIIIAMVLLTAVVLAKFGFAIKFGMEGNEIIIETHSLNTHYLINNTK